MTPKEKAKELISKFTFLKTPESDNKFYNPIQCALICVDEIINACEYNRVESYNTDWWEKVKIEINKLLI